MPAPTVYHDVALDAALDGLGQLFAGKKFWVAQRVPSRNRLIDDIRANGGAVVMLEKQADYLIADPFRRDCPPGSVSYEFVEQSIQHGHVQDTGRHICGPARGEARAPGAVHRPAKGNRIAFTADEDRILYKWVRDAEAAGRSLGGNEIYKQLEAKHPRHPWQSWRDRYMKHLRNRPPSAFNIPDNAPPSPPSDAPAEQVNQNKCTLDQLAALFSSNDWEELYAFVDIIDSLAGQDSYLSSWAAWAKSQENQTAQQWQQYYEKVVRPQWLCDPTWKREQIKLKIDRKHDQSHFIHSNADNQKRQQRSATPVEARSQKVKTQEENLSTELVSEGKAFSSSTARHESPIVLVEMCKKTMKRLHEEDVIDEDNDQAGLSRSAKRPRSAGASLAIESQQSIPSAHQPKPPEISPLTSSLSAPKIGAIEDQSQEQTRRDIIPSLDISDLVTDQATNGSADRSESQDLPAMEHVSPTLSNDDQAPANHFPSNTTTPRAGRRKASNFDTQAILSSLSQDTLSQLPQSRSYIQDAQVHGISHGASSPPLHPESDASTTKSLQEFRYSLDLEDTARTQFLQRYSTNRSTHLSPVLSSSSSSSSSSSPADLGDPDVPLEADEINGFFEEQYADGFDNDFIVKALNRTRLRPGLAIRVLNAWKMGNALPNERGIWSLEDDEAVESGDGVALARIERKHTLDGWGGITERLIFLEAHRSR